jgi:hypothetical protein
LTSSPTPTCQLLYTYLPRIYKPTCLAAIYLLV